MTFWQKMTLSIIVHVAYIDKFPSNEEATDFVDKSQNFLICLEMLFAAVAHCFVFPPEEWAEGYREREERRRKRQSEFETHFGDSVALGDFIKDVKSVMASKRRRRLRKRKSKQSKTLDVNETVIEGEEEHTDKDTGAVGPSLPTESRGSDDVQRNRIDSTESYDDEFDQQFSIDDEDDEVELTSSSFVDAARRSLHAANSTHSSCVSLGLSAGVDYEGSWARIEQYIHEHETDAHGEQASPTKHDLCTKEIV
jgi:hypothetical protein